MARLRAPVHRLLIVCLFIWLEVSAVIMFPRSEEIIEEKYKAARIRLCDDAAVIRSGVAASGLVWKYR